TYFYGVDRSGIPYYDIVLVGASLYFPILYWLTGRKTKNYFANMPVKTRNRLGIVSFFEWSCAATAFIIIGRLMGIDMPISVTLPFFAIGCAVGIISLIPGALGSFDFIVLTGLSAHGLPKETVLAWLLLYRLAYYVIPFFLGIIFFIKHLGGKINQKYNAVPKEMLEKAIHTITINLIRWLGILLALSTVFFENLDYIPWLSSFDPLQRQVIWQ
ncbi:flippase-like domain-containing protein, partial [Streptococcus sobrinus]